MSVEKWLASIRQKTDEEGWITDSALLEEMDNWLDASVPVRIDVGAPVDAREFQREFARVFKRTPPENLVEVYGSFSSFEIRTEQDGDLQYEGNIISAFERQLFSYRDEMGHTVEGFAKECAELYGRTYFPLWFRDSPTTGAAGACLDLESGKVVAVFPTFDDGDNPIIDEIADSALGWLELCEQSGFFAPGAIGSF